MRAGYPPAACKYLNVYAEVKTLTILKFMTDKKVGKNKILVTSRFDWRLSSRAISSESWGTPDVNYVKRAMEQWNEPIQITLIECGTSF